MARTIWFLRIVAILLVVIALHTGSAAAESPVGRWKGSWSSGSTGHRGALRARIRPTEEGTYQALFAGRFAVVIPFFYRTELLPIMGAPGEYYSSKKLPLVGTYQMRAMISGSHFRATFSGGRDQGIFKMRRR